jgi:hypothetical protein
MKKNYFFTVLFCFISLTYAYSQTIVANDDNFTINTAYNVYSNSVRSNDIINGNPSNQFTCNATIVTLLSASGSSITLSSCGSIHVPSSTPIGTYIINYKICLASSPSVCDTATATVNVCYMGNNPEITIISPATCSGAEVLVNNLPETGTWTLSYKHMSNPIVEIQGTGPSTTLNLSPGNYSQISVSNSEGCKSTNLSLYIDYPQGLEATFTPIHVDSNNDGQMSVGDVIIHDVAIKNLLDCDITNIENASNPLINGSIPLLPARMERYLQLCANHNMYVADCTTPANFFHLLRRQMKTNFRKPLIVFTPKSLLRHPDVISTKEELANGSFHEVLDDPKADAKKVKTLVFCTGKFYYDLVAERENLKRDDVAFVRIEQLFPLPVEQLKEVIAKYKNADDYVWAQEEPRNMGAYSYMLMNFTEVKLRVASLKAYSAPAAGSYTRAKKRHAAAIAMVFDRDLFN